MADMGTQPSFALGFSNGLSRAVRQPRRYQAASFKENCKSSWGCLSALVTSMRFASRMAGTTQPLRREKNHPTAEANVREGAGGLLLLAGANETGLLSQLETALASCSSASASSLLACSPRCRRQLMLTLLFLPL